MFAKNSDREPDEAQFLLSVPTEDHPPGSRVKCTYVQIPQVSHTHAVLLSKPFWIWGAEMGVNEHGVAIGNEAVASKILANKKPALIGMDLLRLALERSKTAPDAVHVVTGLLENYGQAGNCGFHRKFYYHNSFIIADPKEAWLLETVDRHWAAKKINGFYAISNGLTMGNEWDMASSDLVNFAVDKKWCKNREDFHFAKCYSDFIFTKFSDCRKRRNRTHELLGAAIGKIDTETMVTVLRDHGAPEAKWRPDRGITGQTVCMHASSGPVRWSQTTGSMVSCLFPSHPTHFFTGTASPCTGIFKPVWPDLPLPDMGPAPKGTYDGASLFWQHERLHRATMGDYATRIQSYHDERNSLEKEFIQNALETALGKPEDRERFSRNCFDRAKKMEERWLKQVTSRPMGKKAPFLYTRAWQKFDQLANMPPI
jgi:secernin